MATLLAPYRRDAVTSTSVPTGQKQRRQYRAPTGLPKPRDNWRLGSTTSVLLHALALVLLLWPASNITPVERGQGAGGAGPAGGGGGGSRGSGAPRETLRYVRVAPVEVPAPVAPPKVTAPVVAPPVKPPPKAASKPDVTPASAVQPPGTGGGTGADGSAGTGPGTGGGVGTGVGTGNGSALGPGTGGGTEANHPPTLVEMFIPPMPVPSSVKGFHLVAEFDVDEKGKVLSVNFTETRDRGYNRRLADVLRSFRFRPGTTPDGKPVRMKAQVAVDLY